MSTTVTKHSCSNRASIRCPVNQAGRPAAKACPVCRSAWYVEVGRWGVFVWTGTGRYPVDAARRIFVSEAAAERHARTNGDDLVVRWIPREAL